MYIIYTIKLLHSVIETIHIVLYISIVLRYPATLQSFYILILSAFITEFVAYQYVRLTSYSIWVIP